MVTASCCAYGQNTTNAAVPYRCRPSKPAGVRAGLLKVDSLPRRPLFDGIGRCIKFVKDSTVRLCAALRIQAGSSIAVRSCAVRPWRYAAAVDVMSRAQLDALVEEATVDSNGEDEQVMGLYTMIADNLATPFQTTVLGMEVTVDDIDLTDRNTIVAHCFRELFRQAIDVLNLPLPTPPPDGAEWIEAYRHWAR